MKEAFIFVLKFIKNFFTKGIYRFFALFLALISAITSILLTQNWIYSLKFFSNPLLNLILSYALSIVIVGTISNSFILFLRLKAHGEKKFYIWFFIWFITSCLSMFSTYVAIYRQNTEQKNLLVEQRNETESYQQLIENLNKKISNIDSQIGYYQDKLKSIGDKNSWQYEVTLKKIENLRKEQTKILDEKNNLISQNTKNAKGFRQTTSYEFISKALNNIISPELIEIIIIIFMAIFIDLIPPLTLYGVIVDSELIFVKTLSETEKLKKLKMEEVLINDDQSEIQKKFTFNPEIKLKQESKVELFSLSEKMKPHYEKIIHLKNNKDKISKNDIINALKDFVIFLFNGEENPEKLKTQNECFKIFGTTLTTQFFSVLREIKDNYNRGILEFKRGKNGGLVYNYPLSTILEIIDNSFFFDEKNKEDTQAKIIKFVAK